MITNPWVMYAAGIGSAFLTIFVANFLRGRSLPDTPTPDREVIQQRNRQLRELDAIRGPFEVSDTAILDILEIYFGRVYYNTEMRMFMSKGGGHHWLSIDIATPERVREWIDGLPHAGGIVRNEIRILGEDVREEFAGHIMPAVRRPMPPPRPEGQTLNTKFGDIGVLTEPVIPQPQPMRGRRMNYRRS